MAVRDYLRETFTSHIDPPAAHEDHVDELMGDFGLLMARAEEALAAAGALDGEEVPDEISALHADIDTSRDALRDLRVFYRTLLPLWEQSADPGFDRDAHADRLPKGYDADVPHKWVRFAIRNQINTEWARLAAIDTAGMISRLHAAEQAVGLDEGADYCRMSSFCTWR